MASMRSRCIHSTITLLQLVAWLLAVVTPCTASLPEDSSGLESAEQLVRPASDRLAHSLSTARMRKVVVKAPEKLRLGTDDFLGSGFKRKSVAGAYGTSVGVSLGAVAIGYQTLNYRSKNREYAIKKEKDARVKEAICSERRRYAAAAAEAAPVADVAADTVRPTAPSIFASTAMASNVLQQDHADLVGLESAPASFSTQPAGVASTAHTYPPSRALTSLERRAPLTDQTLNTIEDYNKMIGASEAVASASIAMTSAHQANQRSLNSSPEFSC
ncbi:septum-promoting GTP-binding protein 1 [Pseudozyma hubeiensis SY62]|uniref:Septum-promoting GTP-binding protein 1 n=1 Tax=Pseudozyma hubeiensis (strain SY62) TaxID=1305764 RepID=R9NVS5_PSEHS|nr:septum-promoting GTP-binding protein 1 [Pseudozyma hubeiensis SY62]GAC92579.1 septum-promoting GTP-binding protein 1 [Pseudozyma hubeiensis SY62]